MNRAQEHERALRLERLMEALREGEEALERGEYVDIRSAEELTAFIAQLPSARPRR